MMFSRRSFLTFLLEAGVATACMGQQGIASPHTTAAPRGKPSGLPLRARFTDISQSAGLTHPVIYGPEDHKTYILETIGCGCAFIDYDNDGWMDIFLLSGTRLGEQPAGDTNRLYRNNRDGTFTEVTEKAGLMHRGWACGVCVGDYDNDGFEDLFVTCWEHNILYHNNGDGTFSDVTAKAGLADSGGRWGTGCTFVDYNRDGWLDLFVSNYTAFDAAIESLPGTKPNCLWQDVAVNCGPRGLAVGVHSLYRNMGNGTFKDVSASSGVDRARSSYGLTVVAADYDDDGWPDIYVAGDSSPSLLLLNNHDGTFREQGAMRGVAYNSDGQEQAGMGVAVNDYDLDGRLDILKTNFAGDVPTLYHNEGRGVFDDAVREAGLAVENRYVAWGAGICDLDNDGLGDIFIVTGHVYPEIEARFPQFPLRTPRLLFHNIGHGRFEQVLPGAAGTAIDDPHCSRGCAFGDFDNDGDLDILIINLNEPPTLLRNDVPGTQHWLKIRLIGVRSNRSAIGARVVVETAESMQTQELLSQSSFLSANDSRLHFGLGRLTSATVRVRWTDGTWESLGHVDAGQLITAKEGKGIVSKERWGTLTPDRPDQ
jgi:enediyne biosynthesis protein E4